MSHRSMTTAAVPEQMRTMLAFGFEAQSTDDHRLAEWTGFGLELTLPSDLKLDYAEGMRAIVGAAVKLGREQAQGEMRRVLGIK